MQQRDRKEAPALRESNLELLRIVAILMIVFAHCAGHGVMQVTQETPYVLWAGGSWINRLFSAFFVAGGDVGVGVFFLITGYFLCRSQKVRRIGPLVAEVGFYALLALAAAAAVWALQGGVSPLSLAAQTLLPISDGTWWFVSSYLIVILMAPAVNALIARMTPRGLAVAFVLFWLLQFAVGKALGVHYYDLLRGLFFYSAGAVLRERPPRIPAKALGLLFGLSWCLYGASTWGIGEILGAGAGSRTVADLLKLARASVFAPAAAAALVLLFLRIPLAENRRINAVASAAFGIYLLHDSPAGRILIWKILFDVPGKYPSAAFPLFMILFCLAVFAAGTAVDLVRRRWIAPAAARVFARISAPLLKQDPPDAGPPAERGAENG